MIRIKGCHLYATDLEELSRFARRIGLSKCWYSSDPYPHFDLICPHLREKAEYLLKKKYKRL